MPQIVGPYRLIQLINTGGIGEVFVAEATTNVGRIPAERAIVVKRLHRELARHADQVALFIAEGRTAQRFSHPHLVHAFEAGSADGDHYIAMELVRGPNLAQLCARGALPVAASLRLARDLCAGLDHMHQQGVVHCDLSPTNILIGPERTLLTDFGVATQLGRAQAQVRGTLGYMSPEQARGEVVDARSDVFAVGIVLWELLARRPLFQRPAPYLTLTAVVEAPTPALPSAPAGVAEVIARALAKAPGDRFASCAEMIAALAAV